MRRYGLRGPNPAALLTNDGWRALRKTKGGEGKTQKEERESIVLNGKKKELRVHGEGGEFDSSVDTFSKIRLFGILYTDVGSPWFQYIRVADQVEKKKKGE